MASPWGLGYVYFLYSFPSLLTMADEHEVRLHNRMPCPCLCKTNHDLHYRRRELYHQVRSLFLSLFRNLPFLDTFPNMRCDFLLHSSHISFRLRPPMFTLSTSK